MTYSRLGLDNHLAIQYGKRYKNEFDNWMKND